MGTKEMYKQIKALQKRLDPLYEKRSKINKAITLKENKKLVGKCYKYLNGCSGQKWIEYYKIVGARDYAVIVLQASKTKEGETQMSLTEQTGGFYRQYCTKITEKLFQNKVKTILDELKEKSMVER